MHFYKQLLVFLLYQSVPPLQQFLFPVAFFFHLEVDADVGLETLAGVVLDVYQLVVLSIGVLSCVLMLTYTLVANSYFAASAEQLTVFA